jgi:hypothetical protein
MRTKMVVVALAGLMIFQHESGNSCAIAQKSESTKGPQFEGLGAHGRKVTTSSADAQRYFDQGLAFLFAFNHDEAIRSFQQATEFDPKCAMAWWGISLANGPHINNPIVSEERAERAWRALDRARANSASASENGW